MTYPALVASDLLKLFHSLKQLSSSNYNQASVKIHSKCIKTTKFDCKKF